MPRFLILTFALIFPGSLSGDDLGTAKVFGTRLDKSNVEPTKAGAETYLRSLLNEENEQRIHQLIQALGSPQYAERESAMAALLRLPYPPTVQLEAARRSEDPEIRVRVRRLMAKFSEQGHFTTLIAVLNVISERELKGLAPLLLQLMPRWEEPITQQWAEQALLATTQPTDAELLRQQMAHAPSPLKEAAVRAFGVALGAESLSELLPLLNASSPALRVAAAEALANLGRRESLPVLVELLEAEEVEVRQRSAAVLRAVTGQRFGFSASAKGESRMAAVNAWREWLNTNGPTAALTFPLPKRSMEMGRTLVCVWGSGTFLEITAEKKEVFSVGGFRYVWGCHVAAAGRRLVVDADQKIVFEYDALGRNVWRRINLPGRPTGVEGLANGNVLVACSDGNQVIEIARDGQIVWSLNLEGRPTTAQRLANGHTVVNLQEAGQVVEVDHQGNVSQLVTGLDRPHTAQLLDNGNVLVTEMRLNSVLEYDLDGRIVWKKTQLNNPAQAQRLANGNTLIADADGLREYAPSGKEVWHLNVTRSRFFRY